MINPVKHYHHFEHEHIRHFIAYSASFLIFGQVIICLGPLIPYMSNHYHIIQTDYSCLFVSRAFGYVIGCAIVRFLNHKLSLHQIIKIGITIMSLFSILFSIFDSLIWKWFFVLILSIGTSLQDATINIAALQCFRGPSQGIWFQALHGSFGIGGLSGPLLVYFLQLNTYLFLGIIGLLTVGLYWFIESPEEQGQIVQQVIDEKPGQQIPKYSFYLICFCFLLVVGQSISFGGWISSYAVLNGFSTKQHATSYSSIYWLSSTIFRFLFSFIRVSPSKKIIFLGYLGIISTIIGYFAIFNINIEFGLLGLSFFLGISNSVKFPLLLTLPQQFGFKLTIKQNSLFMIWSSLGQGCVVAGVGQLMELISNDCLLFCVGSMNLALILLTKININSLSRLKVENFQFQMPQSKGQSLKAKLIQDSIKE